MPLPEAFDYAVDEAWGLKAGDQVAAPLGPRTVRGVVLEVRDARGVNRPLKALAAKLDAPALPEATLKFVQWAAAYACAPPGEALALALRGLRAPPAPPERLVRATGVRPARETPARRRVLDAAVEAMPAARLAEAARVSAGVIKALVEEGCLARIEVPTAAAFAEPDPHRPCAELNPSQAAATAALRGLIDAGGFQAALLDGVTGSGKTEVYLEAVAHVLARDPSAQVLVLLPEIALTQAVLARFEARFGAAPAEWHSAVSPPRRRRVWEAVVAGRCRIVVGARSALFLPFARLRLIVVDEEHDGAFKQEDGFVYQARDFAVARARIEGAAIVLASATPSLETTWNARAGRYAWLRLSTRHGAAQLPQMRLVDLRERPPEPGRWLSPPLVQAMAETFARGEQSLLFLNRRGYAPLVLCRACGERMTAPDTDSWLVEHRYSGRLVCHLTGFSMKKPDACPHCGAKDSLAAIGPGVERLEEEARSLFPDARIAVFSSDTVVDAAGARAMVAAMADGQIDILVATQAAAKGHNFPGLTLVGVVDADLGLKGGDLRAAERTFQLLAQVAGRAGRAERPGRALIQTYMPEHAVMQALAAGDRDGFLAAEGEMRELSELPPYGRLAAVILSSPDAARLDAFARELAAAIPSGDGVEVYGPADAPLALVRGRRRKRFLVRAERRVNIQAFLDTWRARVKVPGAVRMAVDVDPYSFL
jgi:primosomal protein N' (replication factor Y)